MRTHPLKADRLAAIAASLLLAAFVWPFAHLGAQQEGQSAGVKERFTALVANMSGFGPPTSETVQIGIERWSTDAEREQLRTELVENGQEGLLRTLRKLPRVGYIRTLSSIGWDLHYASEVRTGGSRRILIATDRPISFWEAANRPRTIDYPFTLIELRIGPKGEGEGKMTIATKVTWNARDRVVELENYGSQPAHLLGVHADK